jgi:hypothetical protein
MTLTSTRLIEVLHLLSKRSPELMNDILSHFDIIFNQSRPILQHLGVLLDIIFSPRLLLKRLILAVGLQGALFTLQRIGNGLQYMLRLCFRKGRRVLELKQQMTKTATFIEWKRIADQLDQLQGTANIDATLLVIISKNVGLDKWRNHPESRLYDCKVLKKRINDIKWMITNGDVFNLMFRLRGGLARDMYGMQHEGLFSRAIGGTKLLVEEYHDTVSSALNFICDTESSTEVSPHST